MFGLVCFFCFFFIRGGKARYKLENSGRRIQSDPRAPVRPRSAWALLCGGIFEPWSYLRVPPSLILSTYMSCCDGACVTALLRRCLAPHQLSSAKLLTALQGVFLPASPPPTHSLSNLYLQVHHLLFFFSCNQFFFSFTGLTLLPSLIFVTNLPCPSLAYHTHTHTHTHKHTHRCLIVLTKVWDWFLISFKSSIN